MEITAFTGFLFIMSTCFSNFFPECCPHSPSPSPSSPLQAVRIGEVKRETPETNVFVKINLDDTGVSDSSTGISFLDHMLDQIASHGLLDLNIKARGNIHFDDHHTKALLRALGDRKGINRFGDFSVPLDEALIHISLLAGRNSHHIIEPPFKAFARALRQATKYDPRRHGTVPSSKGVLSLS